MPWFPDFANAAELARRSTRAAGHGDPVAQYLAALADGDPGDLATTWPGGVVVHDPRAGDVHGHHHLRRFVKQSRRWLDEHGARIETVASTVAANRAVVELVAHLTEDGHAATWPVAVVAEATDETSVVFRTYCSQVPVDGRRHVRPPLLAPGVATPEGAVGRHLAALAAGDVDALVSAFAPGGYVREAIGSPGLHRGPDEIRSFYSAWFGEGGGLGLRCCLVTDDGVRCAVEYTCDSWGGHRLPPQAGILVYERDPGGRLAAVRAYDDLEAPVRTS
ncbi:nuclear transport factor 2 family protein [Nocardioides sp. CER19]|uniref:nuclear transport factor 2 family protein n=1 Tax=Nocardioides sp. CER19 TaxID=3038538 RepID=UPI002446CC99|nr:nuclear transport factor 2 family protein [Nocardioides sp. CER19]MDH2415948.1 nuclear transport factor 2 family protein [Nocardioides sp. CER19]